MQIVGEIPHPECRITLFRWGNRTLIKVEQHDLEQTFKLDAVDLPGEVDVKALVNEKFIRETLDRFESMRHSLRKAIDDQNESTN